MTPTPDPIQQLQQRVAQLEAQLLQLVALLEGMQRQAQRTTVVLENMAGVLRDSRRAH